MSVSDLTVLFNQDPSALKSGYPGGLSDDLYRLYRDWLLQTLDVYMVRCDVALDDEIEVDDLTHLIDDLELYDELVALVNLRRPTSPYPER